MERHKITRPEIKEAIYSSGYLIEQRVLRIFSESYLVEPNHSYVDSISGKTREIDMRVDSAPFWDKLSSGGLYWSILCECENNAQPIVLFPFEPFMPSAGSGLVKCYGMPMKIWQKNEYVGLLEFLQFHKFHHYCKGSVATQYCSFVKPRDKSKWLATHLEEQHDTFNSLVCAVDYEINQFYGELWRPPKPGEPEPILLVFIYPLVVLAGELMEAHLGRQGLVTNKVKHVQFFKSLHSAGREIGCKIDVITENYLREYMAIIDDEMNKLQRLITRHQRTLTQSVDHIIKDVKDTKTASSYRGLLTLES